MRIVLLWISVVVVILTPFHHLLHPVGAAFNTRTRHAIQWSGHLNEADTRPQSKLSVYAPDRIVADSPTRVVEFMSTGFRYVPRGISVPDFHFGLETISAGNFLLRVRDHQTLPQLTGESEVSYPRGFGVTEVYLVFDNGIEQLFFLKQNPNPAARALIISGRVLTELWSPVTTTVRGITFYADGRAALHYGPVTVIDAKGRTLRAEMAFTGTHLNIIIDGAWLREATYPVVVDPFIGPVTPIAATPSAAGHPAMASDTDHGRYLVVWEQETFGDSEIMGQLIDASGSPATCHPDPFPISRQQRARDTSPAIVYDPSRRRFLVVWEERDSDSAMVTSRIKGRFVGSPDDCASLTPAGSALELTRGDARARAPDVAVGVLPDGTTRFLVVFLKQGAGEEADVFGQIVTEEGMLSGDSIYIGGPTGFAPRFHPSVAFGEAGRAEFFSVVYRAADRVLRMARVTPAGKSQPVAQQLIVDPVVNDDPADGGPLATDVRPVIAYSRWGHRWMVSWIDYSPRFGAVLQWMEVLATSFLWQSTFTTLLGPFRYVRGLSLTSSPHSPDFVAALAVGVSPRTGFDIFVFQLQYRIDFFSATLRRDTLAGGSWNDWYPIIGASSQPEDYFVVWQRNLPDGTFDIVGQSYVP